MELREIKEKINTLTEKLSNIGRSLWRPRKTKKNFINWRRDE